MDEEQLRIAEVLFEMGVDKDVIDAITGQKKDENKPKKE